MAETADTWQTHGRHGRHMADTAHTWQTHGRHSRHMADTWQTWQTHGRHMVDTADTWQTCQTHGRNMWDTWQTHGFFKQPKGTSMLKSPGTQDSKTSFDAFTVHSNLSSNLIG